MKQRLTLNIIISIAIVFSSTGQQRPSETPNYRLYLIGDAGMPGGNPTLDLLKIKLHDETIPNGIIFLGDIERKGDLIRTFQLIKMRGANHSRTKSAMSISTKNGVELAPLL